MKVLEKILIIIFICLSLLTISKETFATEWQEEKNEIIIDEAEIEKEGQRLYEEEKDRTRAKADFKLLTKEQEEKIAEIINIKQKDKNLVIAISLICLILLIVTIKTDYVQGSTKALVIVIIMATFSIALKYMVQGSILNFLDIFIPTLGAILIAISYYFIYKHNNLLIYIPVCAAGTYYCINNIDIIADNILYKIILILLPIILLIVGKTIEKAADMVRVIPVKEKSERKKDEKQQ